MGGGNGESKVSNRKSRKAMTRFLYYLSFALFGISFGMAATQFFVFGEVKPMGWLGLISSAFLLYLVERPEKPKHTNENILDHNFEDLKQ